MAPDEHRPMYERRAFQNGHSVVLGLPPELRVPPGTPARITVIEHGEDGHAREILVRFGSIQFSSAFGLLAGVAALGMWIGTVLGVVV